MPMASCATPIAITAPPQAPKLNRKERIAAAVIVLAQRAKCRAIAASGFSKKQFDDHRAGDEVGTDPIRSEERPPRFRTFPVGVDASRVDALDRLLVRKIDKETDNRNGMARADHLSAQRVPAGPAMQPAWRQWLHTSGSHREPALPPKATV
jgi:hypothetical protein